MTSVFICQAIRQWDQALRERNDYRDALAKVQRQHEEAVKAGGNILHKKFKENYTFSK